MAIRLIAGDSDVQYCVILANPSVGKKPLEHLASLVRCYLDVDRFRFSNVVLRIYLHLVTAEQGISASVAPGC